MRFKDYAKFNTSRLLIALAFIIILFSLNSAKVSATIKNTINYQIKLTSRGSNLNAGPNNSTCIITSSADTCDFRIRIWNVSTGGTATAGNNLLYEELFTNLEIGDNNSIVNLTLNSVCGATQSGTHAWGTTGASATVCNLFDDNADTDSVTGVNFNRADLYIELTFDPSGAWTSLASPPAGIEVFDRTIIKTAPSAFVAQSLNGFTSGDFLQLSPSSIQTTTSASGAIRVNQQGSGNLIQLQSSGTDRLVVNNSGQLQLATQGSNGGLSLGDGGVIYRSAANVLNISTSLEVVLNSTINGLSNFKGNAKSLVTAADGSTLTSGTGTSSRNLTVSSTTNFNAGNLILVNSTTYARIDSVDSSTNLTVTPALTWSASQGVVEYTVPFVGGDGLAANLNQQFDSAFVISNIKGGDSTTTSYGDKVINAARGLKIESSNLTITSTQTNINTSGLIINKSDNANVAGTWSTGRTGGTARAHGLTAMYQGKIYYWSGALTGQILTNILEIYDPATNSWSTGASGGTARATGISQVYDGKWYIWGGCDNNTCSTYSNVLDIYDFVSNSWSTGATGGTARAAASSVLRQGSIYIWAGCNGASCSGTLTSMDIYNIASNSWSTGVSGGNVKISGVGLLYNDKIYSWSGLNASFVSSNTLDIYDIKTRTWTTGATGGSARYYASGTVFDNKMYAWGGQAVAALNTMDIYDFGTNTWSTGVTGGTARNRYYGQFYSGKYYAWGGVIDSGSVNMINTMDIYDFGSYNSVLKIRVGDQEMLNLTTDNVLNVTGQALGLNYPLRDAGQYTATAWTTATSGGTAKRFIQAQEYGNKIYLWGGYNVTPVALNTMDIYDPVTDSWTTGATGGTARYSYTSTIYNGKIYYFGGCTTATSCAAGSVINTVDVYTIATNTWSTATAGGTARGQAVGGQYDNKFYIWGGLNTTPTVINTVDIYNFTTNSWTTGLAGGTARNQAMSVVYNGKLIVWGGVNVTPAVINTVDIYDFLGNVWTTGTAGGTARFGAGTVFYNGQMYNWGGCTVSGCGTRVNTVDIYNPATNTWSVGIAGGTATGSVGSVVFNGKWYNIMGVTTAVVNTVFYYDFGTSKAEDVFYITNPADVAPDEGKLFRFDSTGRAYTSKQGGWFSVGADYAEYMHVNDLSLEPGDIVKLDKSDAKSLIKTNSQNDPDVIGVISTDPGFVGNITNVEDVNSNRSDMKLLSMVGQVPVKVNTQNGEIKSGDRITTSSIPGIGMKASEGESNIGIAQESYSGNGIGLISILITRNNEGISNKLQINLGLEGEAGFRLSSEGKMQYKDNKGEWLDISRQTQLDTSMAWKKIGDNVFNSNTGSISIGVSEQDLTGSKLQISKDVEAKDGLKFLKLTSEGTILIGGFSTEIGFRVNSSTGALEFKDNLSKDWKNMSGILISKIKVNPDGSIESIANARQLSGWGFIKNEGTLNTLTKEINIGSNVNNLLVLSNIIGASDREPNSATDCSDLLESEVSSKVNMESNNKFHIIISDPSNSVTNKFICFNWIAVGNN